MFATYAHNEQVTVKILTINHGEQLSVQYHQHRSECWRVLSGAGDVLQGDVWQPCAAGDEFVIAQGQQHALRAGTQQLVVLEIARGDFDEDDIVRVSDVYGRA
jgi:mannose-6-phosphate isomerase